MSEKKQLTFTIEDTSCNHEETPRVGCPLCKQNALTRRLRQLEEGVRLAYDTLRITHQDDPTTEKLRRLL